MRTSFAPQFGSGGLSVRRGSAVAAANEAGRYAPNQKGLMSQRYKTLIYFSVQAHWRRLDASPRLWSRFCAHFTHLESPAARVSILGYPLTKLSEVSSLITIHYQSFVSLNIRRRFRQGVIQIEVACFLKIEVIRWRRNLSCPQWRMLGRWTFSHVSIPPQVKMARWPKIIDALEKCSHSVRRSESCVVWSIE